MHSVKAHIMSCSFYTEGNRHSRVNFDFVRLILMQMYSVVLVLKVSTRPLKQWWRLHDSFHPPSSNICDDGVDKLQKVIGMAHHNSNNVHGNGISQQHTKGQHDPRQVRGIECKESQKAHFDVFVSSSPYINHHECQSASQKVYMRVNGNQRNASNSKQEHHDIVGRSATEVPFFQQSTVPDLSG